MRIFWGRDAQAEDIATGPNPVTRALQRAIKDGKAGPPFEGVVGAWQPGAGKAPVADESDPRHPARYLAYGARRPEAGGDAADPEALIEAINTALLLGKPLLLTGNPGTGKSELAERVAWEFNLGPVLRFESQSLSEANDLFYRYDLVGRLAAVESAKAALALDEPYDKGAASTGRHLHFDALGLAILRADPAQAEPLRQAGLRLDQADPAAKPRQSVVLIDEIDKTSRDFPNDLLNQIERMEFRVRELGNRLVHAPKDESLRPIVLITSNSERELPAPFLRRCIYFHIDDPTRETLARILRSRLPGAAAGGEGGSGDGLRRLYAQVLDLFIEFRDDTREGELSYRPGTSELINLATAMHARHAQGADESLSSAGNLAALRRAAATLVKHRADRATLETLLKRWQPA